MSANVLVSMNHLVGPFAYLSFLTTHLVCNPITKYVVSGKRNKAGVIKKD